MRRGGESDQRLPRILGGSSSRLIEHRPDFLRVARAKFTLQDIGKEARAE